MSLSYRNQSIDLLRKSMDWFIYDSDLRHEKVNKSKVYQKEISKRSQYFIFHKHKLSMLKLCRFIAVTSKKYIETAWNFRSSSLRRKYIEMTSIFRPSKLRRTKHFQSRPNFRLSKLHRKIWGNDVKTSRYFLFDINLSTDLASIRSCCIRLELNYS